MQNHLINLKAANWQTPVALVILAVALLCVGNFIATDAASEGDAAGRLLGMCIEAMAWVLLGLATVLLGKGFAPSIKGR